VTTGFKLGTYSDKPVGGFVVPDEGFYVMTLDDWDEPVRSSYIDKETGEYPWRVNLKFKIVNALGDEGATNEDGTDTVGATCGKFVEVDLNPNAKGSIWHVLLALDPINEPEPGGAIEVYRGKKLIGEIEHIKKPSKNNPGETVTYANVGAVKAFKKPKKQAEPAKNPLLDDEEI
jgi:hypothetical protein